jgi:hypothetical protein
MGWIKRVFSAANLFIGARNTWTLLKLLAPGVAGAISGWLADMSGWPLASIWLSFLAGLALTSVFLFVFSRWLTETSPQHKFRIEAVQWNIELDGNGDPKSMGPILLFRNLAVFPISFRIQKLEWNFAGRLPPKAERAVNSGSVVEPLGNAAHITPAADLQHLDLSKPTLDGDMNVEIVYGIKGREKYPWQKRFVLIAHPQPKRDGLPPFALVVLDKAEDQAAS